ncbi:glutathione S-transferase C-terminal domain-containing protein [Streptomyces sp. RTGN2]|uniref:glutathione S-transferase C-terminal domain-containing protein n=1 Tax=Streptomyces sp. RTGN2 TaxID=3016525 RepID=UPI0025545D16|nr:glutathione S-transferase C-terminal domain-containing protein [Streptomyces sp. RTGN2]
MPETASRGCGTGNACTFGPASSAPASRPSGLLLASAVRSAPIHSRIGVGLAGGFYPAPHRYELFLSVSCPRSLRISITLGLLGLKDSVATTLLTHPAGTPEGFAALRGAYEATVHHYNGALTAPALCDRWSGRIVSNHTPDILRDLAGLLSGHDEACPSPLHPPELAADIDGIRELLELRVTDAAEPSERSAALDVMERRLSLHPYVCGPQLTAADVDLWVTLVQPGTAGFLCGYPRLQEFVGRLGDHPAFPYANGVVAEAA